MNIWLVSLFENTPIDDNQNTRFNSLVNEAIKRGHNVTYWASTFRHNTKKLRFATTTQKNISPKLELIFVKTKPYKKNISMSRLWSHYKISKELIKEFNLKLSPPDVVLIAYPPISTTREVVQWCNKRDIPVIADIIDPWPSVFETHLKGYCGLFKWGLLPMQMKARRALSNVNAITAISQEYITWSKQYTNHVPTSYFYPAIDLQKVEEQLANIEKQDSNSFIVIYAGSLGYSYDLPTILGAAEKLESEYSDRIKFVIAGDGPQKELVRKYEEDHTNLVYLGRIPKEKLIKEYRNANLGVTQHTKGATQSVTYKLFDLLSCGLPILNSLESEMRDIILNNKVGLHNKPGDVLKLVENIEYYFNNPEDYGEAKTNALRLTREKGDSVVVYKEMMNFITDVVNS